MTDLYQPSISYWQGTGTQVSATCSRMPASALSQTSLVLLIHGYNNDLTDGSAAFRRFLQLQKNTRTVTANLVGVYWPGSNWEKGLYYMQALGQVQQVAPGFAQDLYQAAQARKYLKIDIVAHSLGCRLALETTKQLLRIKQNDPSLGGLVIGQVAFMAGAVPTEYIAGYIEDINRLRTSLMSFQATLSLFSENDRVLHWAFPVGQSLAHEGFFPVALGRKKWVGDTFLSAQIKQVRSIDADHGDYWGADSKKIAAEQFAADTVGDFLTLGPPVPRTTIQNVAADTRTTLSRDAPDGRAVPVRTV